MRAATGAVGRCVAFCARKPRPLGRCYQFGLDSREKGRSPHRSSLPGKTFGGSVPSCSHWSGGGPAAPIAKLEGIRLMDSSRGGVDDLWSAARSDVSMVTGVDRWPLPRGVSAGSRCPSPRLPPNEPYERSAKARALPWSQGDSTLPIASERSAVKAPMGEVHELDPIVFEERERERELRPVGAARSGSSWRRIAAHWLTAYLARTHRGSYRAPEWWDSLGRSRYTAPTSAC